MEKRAKMKLLWCSLLIVSITRVTFHPGWLEPSPFSPVRSSFIVTIPEWTLHHLVTLFPNCPGWLVAGLLASTPHFASYLFSVTCFLCSNTLAFPDDGQVPKWSARKSTLEWGQRPAPFRENCEVLGPAAQYLLSCLLNMQLTLPVHSRRRGLNTVSSSHSRPDHLSSEFSHRWIALKMLLELQGVQMHSPTPLSMGTAWCLQWGRFMHSVKLSQRGQEFLCCISVSCIF